MSAERRLVRDGRWPFQEIEGRAVVVVPEHREVHQLDETGTFIWNLLRDPRSRAEIVQAVTEEFEVEPDLAARDVEAFLELLLAKSLATEQGNAAPRA
jgi:hypothetical protein